MTRTHLLLLILLPAASAEVHEVHVIETGDMDTWAFTPASVDADAGDTIRFIDDTMSGDHTVTSDDADFHQEFNGEHGDVIDVLLDAPGSFRFYCTPHPWMETFIEVAAPPGADATAGDPTREPTGGPTREQDTPAITSAGLLGALLTLAMVRRHLH